MCMLCDVWFVICQAFGASSEEPVAGQEDHEPADSTTEATTTGPVQALHTSRDL